MMTLSKFLVSHDGIDGFDYKDFSKKHENYFVNFRGREYSKYLQKHTVEIICCVYSDAY